MTLVDWRSLTASELTPLYAHEQRRWRDALGWDTTGMWRTIEQARTSWGLPGYVCRDRAGNVHGWTYFIQHDARLEIGGIVADDASVTGMLIDAIVACGDTRQTPVARRRIASNAAHGGPSSERDADRVAVADAPPARAIGGFVYPSAPGLVEALATRGVHVEPYSYLLRSTAGVDEHKARGGVAAEGTQMSGVDDGRAAIRAWRQSDLDAAAALLHEAYGEEGALFAPQNTPAEWRTYVEHLRAFEGCGRFQPLLSRVVEHDRRLAGVALVTALASDTAHLAQIAVRPCMRREGLARRLLSAALTAAESAGYAQMSLLVADRNGAARRLYDHSGFTARDAFVALR